MQTQQKKKPMLTQFSLNALKTSKEESGITSRGEADDINSNLSSSSDCNLFKRDRSFRADRAHFPSTIHRSCFKKNLSLHISNENFTAHFRSSLHILCITVR